MTKVAFLFPGQGAQAVGMGRDFHDQYSVARELFEWSGSLVKRDLRKMIFEGPESELLQTKNCQLALFVVSLAILAVLRKEFPRLEPIAAAGLSLGEYTALVASEKAAFEEVCPLVGLRGALMQEACRKREGKMAAVLGLSSEQVEALVAELGSPELWVANYNTPLQTVISGSERAVKAASELAEKRGAKRVIPLAVDGGFHSGLMQEAENQLRGHLQGLKIQESGVGLVMNASGDFASEPKKIAEGLSRQITSSVRWHQGMSKIQERGPAAFIEVGPGRVLSGFNRQMSLSAPTYNLSKLSDLETLSNLNT